MATSVHQKTALWNKVCDQNLDSSWTFSTAVPEITEAILNIRVHSQHQMQSLFIYKDLWFSCVPVLITSEVYPSELFTLIQDRSQSVVCAWSDFIKSEQLTKCILAMSRSFQKRWENQITCAYLSHIRSKAVPVVKCKSDVIHTDMWY